MKIAQEEYPLSLQSKIQYLNGLAVKYNEPTWLISEKEEKQILDDQGATRDWSLVDTILEKKCVTVNDILELMKENKQLKETQLRTDNYVMKLQQKLEEIQKLVNDKDFLVTRRQLVEILKEKS